MRAFKDQPIGRKAMILGLVPTISALLIASAAYLVSTYVSIRNSTVNDMATSAAIIADSIDVAVGFERCHHRPSVDRGAAREAQHRPRLRLRR